MTQHRGQGLNHAICDIANLVSVLNKANKGEFTLKDAIDEYDAEMIKRGGDEVQAALVNAQMLHDWNSLMQSDLMSKSVSRGN
jgi:2-polyprenyl-6-methoxyphenol hydroxylase-like FAD-dependent oxidoreductase